MPEQNHQDWSLTLRFLIPFLLHSVKSSDNWTKLRLGKLTKEYLLDSLVQPRQSCFVVTLNLVKATFHKEEVASPPEHRL